MCKCANIRAIKLSLLAILWACIASAQKIIKVEKASDHSTYIKGNNFEGVIFDKSYKFSKYKGFTPTTKQIKVFESEIIGELKGIRDNEHDAYKMRSITAILKQLSQYRRQYFGYVNEKGYKVIEAHFLFNKDLSKSWTTSKIVINGGGMKYWQLKSFGIDTLYEFNVNRPR